MLKEFSVFNQISYVVSRKLVKLVTRKAVECIVPGVRAGYRHVDEPTAA